MKATSRKLGSHGRLICVPCGINLFLVSFDMILYVCAFARDRSLSSWIENANGYPLMGRISTKAILPQPSASHFHLIIDLWLHHLRISYSLERI